jgi:integrase
VVGTEKTHASAKGLRIEHDNLRHAFPHFSEKLLCHVEARDIDSYQKARLSEGAAPKTINLEVGTLRAVLRRYGQWTYLRPDVRMFPTHEECGYALTPLEEEALLKACLMSRSRSLYVAVTLALMTAMRLREIRLLTWKQIDLVGATATVGESKTPASTGRNTAQLQDPNGCKTVGVAISLAAARAFRLPLRAVWGCGGCLHGVHLPYESFATHHFLESRLEGGETAGGFRGARGCPPRTDSFSRS